MDVFLAHNSQDKPFVRNLAGILRDRGIDVWFDEDDLPPNELINEVIDRAIRTCGSVAICFGNGGEGPIQRSEIDQAFNLAMHAGKSIMTVLLPGVDEAIRPQRLRGYRPIVFSSTPDESTPIDLLIWGITGEKPTENEERPPAPSPSPSQSPVDAVENAVTRLHRSMLDDGINFIVGPICGRDDDSSLPGPYELARSLLVELQLLDDDHSGVLPTPDSVGSCYAVSQGADGLENAVCRQINARADAAPRLPESLAALTRKWDWQKPARAGKRLAKPLFLTTNFDLFLERSMLLSGVSFSRVVHNVSRNCLHVSEYRGGQKFGDDRLRLTDGAGETRDVRIDDHDEIDAFLRDMKQEIVEAAIGSSPTGSARQTATLSLSKMLGPVIYKYHGSQDVPGSCAISSEQYYYLTKNSLMVPKELRERLANSPSVFLGFGYLCSEFQQMYESLLKDAFTQRELATRYAVQERPESGQRPDPNLIMEVAVSADLSRRLERMGLRLLDTSAERFVERLGSRFRAPDGNGSRA